MTLQYLLACALKFAVATGTHRLQHVLSMHAILRQSLTKAYLNVSLLRKRTKHRNIHFRAAYNAMRKTSPLPEQLAAMGIAGHPKRRLDLLTLCLQFFGHTSTLSVFVCAGQLSYHMAIHSTRIVDEAFTHTHAVEF